LGGIDIADDGSFIATGGTDNKLYILDRNTKSKTEIPFNEYIEEVDISANGKYIAAGTGGSVYFFETYISQDRGKVFDCSKVIEPTPENQLTERSSTTEVKRKLGILEMIVNFIKNLFSRGDSSTSSQSEPASGSGVCGNDLCEPGLGETRENCSKDCMGGD